jgi:ParB-like chromosome segregation protein Spo0J
MAISNEVEYTELDNLALDPMNPRLGRAHTGREVTQERVLELMHDWTLEELAVSFLESGYWPQEALLVVREELYGQERLVVVEGNRRLAALMYLHNAINGIPASRKWAEIAASKEPPANLFGRIPYLVVDSREEIQAFLGFRHVTGIKEWKPAEKAEYIAKLIEERDMTYEEVRRKIGSKTPTVRQNYISYRLLLQMEDREDISVEKVEEKFSVLYLSLRTAGVQKYLQIDIQADPAGARRPVPDDRLQQLARFALWLFGSDDKPPLFTDSRLVDDFGTILDSDEAVEYLEESDRPNFEVAFRKAGGDEPELEKLINNAANNIQLTLTRVHHYTQSENIRAAVQQFGLDAWQLLSLFPDIRENLIAG